MSRLGVLTSPAAIAPACCPWGAYASSNLRVAAHGLDGPAGRRLRALGAVPTTKRRPQRRRAHKSNSRSRLDPAHWIENRRSRPGSPRAGPAAAT